MQDKESINMIKDYVFFLEKRAKDLLALIEKYESKEKKLMESIQYKEVKLKEFPALIDLKQDKLNELKGIELRLNQSIDVSKKELNNLKNEISHCKEEVKQKKGRPF